MPRRRRWTPVKGTGSRVHDPGERLLLGAMDLPGRLVAGALRRAGWRRPTPPVDPASVREALVLRLDRIGDVIMSLSALADLRAALPHARIRLAVGKWSADIARTAPVDEVLVWSAPWVGRRREGADGVADLLRRARALRKARLDLAIDLQGDVRAALLLSLTGARHRVGYANTGGSWLLTDVVPLDETLSWVEQNRRAVASVVGRAAGRPVDLLTVEERGFGRRLVADLGLAPGRPLVGVHPGGGRTVKQWDVGRWAEVAERLHREFAATIVLTGAEGDRPVAQELARRLPFRPVDLTGRLSLRETVALLAQLDLFLSPDTGTMHAACAVGTPSVSVFGPSDPGRYFSGGTGESGRRHVVVRAALWCAPCNLIRNPPSECDDGAPPECLRRVEVDDVHREAARLLCEAGGYAAREPTGA
ncbi:MAG TPA: glycosyltransferase family 9 protein [Vicinamibacteria bacterium]